MTESFDLRGGAAMSDEASGDYGWQDALDLSFWTITQAITFTTDVKGLVPYAKKQDRLRDGLGDLHKAELADHPFYTVVRRAMANGELEEHIVDDNPCVVPLAFIRGRAQRRSWGRIPVFLQMYVEITLRSTEGGYYNTKGPAKIADEYDYDTSRTTFNRRALRIWEHRNLPREDRDWDIALAAPLWTLRQAIRCTTQIVVSEEEQAFFDSLNAEPIDEPIDYALLEHPLTTFALDAIQTGELKGYSKDEPEGAFGELFPEHIKVNREEFLKWRLKSTHLWPLRPELEACWARHEKNKGDKGRKIAEHFALDREQVFGAAVACLVKYPELCKAERGDKMAAVAIVDTIEKFEARLFEKIGGMPLSKETAVDQLRDWIKKLKPN